jgi:lysophospholipase L1-like esterase
VVIAAAAAALALRSSPSAQAVPQPAGSTPSGSGLADGGSASAVSSSPTGPSTEAPSTSSAALPPGRDVLVLGDSLALDVYPWLADLLPDRYVSYAAVVGRDTPATSAALRTLDADGQVPPVVLVSLGTNDFDAKSFRMAAEQILTLLGPRRCVVWSDVVRPTTIRGDAAAINAEIDMLAATHPNVHVMRWSATVAAHPDWLSGDGIHPGQEGAAARAKSFADEALACSPLDAAAPHASREYLPPSAFNAPGGSSTTDRLPPQRSAVPTKPRSSSDTGGSGSPVPTASAQSGGRASSAPASSTPRSSAAVPSSSAPPPASTPQPSAATSGGAARRVS